MQVVYMFCVFRCVVVCYGFWKHLLMRLYLGSSSSFHGFDPVGNGL
jgi:hypothetical protein